MHTFVGSQGTIFHYNSDLSGRVIVASHDKEKRETYPTEVPGIDILDFVAEFVQSEKISKLEEMDTRELLGLLIIQNEDISNKIKGFSLSCSKCGSKKTTLDIKFYHDNSGLWGDAEIICDDCDQIETIWDS